MEKIRVKDFKVCPDPEHPYYKPGHFYNVVNVSDKNGNHQFYFKMENNDMPNGRYGFFNSEREFILLNETDIIVIDDDDIFICTNIISHR